MLVEKIDSDSMKGITRVLKKLNVTHNVLTAIPKPVLFQQVLSPLSLDSHILNIFYLLTCIGQNKLLIAKRNEHQTTADDKKRGDYGIDAYSTCFHSNDFIVLGKER
jgi:hypothetical protein